MKNVTARKAEKERITIMMEMTITVNIPGLERLADAILALAGVKGSTTEAAPAQQDNAPVTQQPTAFTTPVAPVQPAVPVQPPVQQAAPANTYQQPSYPVQPQMPAGTAGQGAAAPGAPAGYAPQMPASQPVMPTTATAPQYTQDQLAVAATGLVDAGRSAVLIGILQQFGANSLMDLPQDQYGAFAVKLREAGARI